jgi:integrase
VIWIWVPSSLELVGLVIGLSSSLEPTRKDDHLAFVEVSNVVGKHGPLLRDAYLRGTVEVKPTPHRFRHTFARIILQRGVSVRDVADLLGNSEQMVRKHYAAWIPERQARLTRILQEAFTDRPKPRVINMPDLLRLRRRARIRLAASPAMK